MNNQVVSEISKLSNAEIIALIDELEKTDPGILKEYKEVLGIGGFSTQEVGEFVVMNRPKSWAQVYLNWESRDYQDDILLEGKNARRLVLRLGRRLGKTETICVLILWHAFIQPNKGTNNQYDILIITPFETQIQLIFTRIRQLIDASPALKGSITRDIEGRIEFKNGTAIIGLTAGSKSGSGAANTRGQRADLIVLDEIDYMGVSEITNVINIANEDPQRIKILAASTPSGRRDNFYKWCRGASRSYAPSKDDVENYRFSGYIKSAVEKGKGNGWVEIYAPSIVNKQLLMENPDTGRSYLEDLKEELTDLRFTQEVMAEFGEEEMGVYLKKYVDKAIAEGARVKHKYLSDMSREELAAWHDTYVKLKAGPLILGVDWDKYSAATNMVILGLDPYHTDEHGRIRPKFKVWDRIEIPRDDFTYANAIDRIIDLNDMYEFDHIVVDKGYGETQIELLHKYGLMHPRTGLHIKTKGYQFSEKVKVIDPYTGQVDKKPFKPFMVNNSVMVFEREAIVIGPNDHSLISQLEQYRIKSISSSGIPTYTSENEHALDAMNLALVMMERQYGELFKGMTHNSKVMTIPKLTSKSEDDKIVSRDIEKAKIISLIPPKFIEQGRHDEVVNKIFGKQISPSRRSNASSIPTRRSF